MQNGGCAAIMNCYLDTLDHPRILLHGPKSVLKFHVNRTTTFRAMVICKFGLNCPFPRQKYTFKRCFHPKHYFSSSRVETRKGTSLHETASYELSCFKLGSAILAVGDDKE